MGNIISLEQELNPDGIYSRFVGIEPALIDGRNFRALNYGLGHIFAYQNYLKMIISNAKKSYYAQKHRRLIPKGVTFERADGHMPFVNMSHIIKDITNCKTKMTFNEFIKLLKAKGMGFR